MGLNHEILTREKMRCDAMLAKDRSALEDLIDPRLHFTHATGGVDDKNTYIAKVVDGRIDYLSIDWIDMHVEDLGEAAFLTGRMSSRVRVAGEEKELNNRVLAVWRRARGAWVLIAFNPTPIRT